MLNFSLTTRQVTFVDHVLFFRKLTSELLLCPFRFMYKAHTQKTKKQLSSNASKNASISLRLFRFL